MKDVLHLSNKRLFLIALFIVFLFFFILLRLCQLILFQRESYVEELSYLVNREVSISSAPRGRIYDRNHKLIVDNRAVTVVYYQKQDGVSVKEEVELAYTIALNMEIDVGSVSEKNLKDFYLVRFVEESNTLITEEEYKDFQKRKLSENDIYSLKLERITPNTLKIFSDLDKEAAYVYYLMNNGYSYEQKVIKKTNLTQREIAYIAEHVDELKGFNVKYDWERVYLYGNTFRSLLGNISSITKEEKEYYLAKGYSLNDLVGVSYLEKQYEDILRGTKGKYKLLSQNNIELESDAVRGKDIVLTIDIELQQEIEKILDEEIIATKREANTNLFNHAYVVIQEPNTGEILAMAGRGVKVKNGNYESYDASVGLLTNTMTVGSVVKAASLLVGFNEEAVSIGEYQLDECVKLYLNPPKCSWETMGRINDITALKNSSNVYQFKIAMKVAGFSYRYNAKFSDVNDAFDIYRSTFNEFGLGVKTGIDLPNESSGNIGKKNSSDLLLNYVIGQYDTYTALQLSQYITTIASDGKRYQPHLLKAVHEATNNNALGEVIYEVEPVVLNTVDTKKKYLRRVQEGLREVMKSGLGYNFMGNSPSPSGKTGTSESFMDIDNDGKIDTPTVSNAFVGYAPSDNPVMTITTMFPNLVDGRSDNDLRSFAHKRITRRLSETFFKLYES